VWGIFKLREYTLGAIERFSSEEDVPQISGRLEASVTVLPFLRNERVGQFKSFEHLKQALLASSCLVPLAGSPVWVDGLGYCIDGGLSDLQLLKGMSVGGTFSKIHVKGSPEALRSTITVCPFYSSRADIKPSRYLPPWWAFIPPSVAELDAVYRLGCAPCIRALHPIRAPHSLLARLPTPILAPLPRLRNFSSAFWLLDVLSKKARGVHV